MKKILQKALRVLGVPIRVLAVWLTFLVVLWISRGAARGYPAFLIALSVAIVLWWRHARRGSRRGAILSGAAMILATAPLAYVLVPLASSSLAPLPADASVQLWTTGAGRAVAVYRFPADAATDRKVALVFAHGGPGGYIRDFDRDFFASFARAGFEVVLYDQFGAGRSPLGDPKQYTHKNNVSDLAAVLARVDKPTVLVGQSYGATLVTSALAIEDVRKRVTHVVLTEPGRIPGAVFSSSKSMSEKTTLAPDATLAPSANVAGKLVAPRALLAAFLPAGNNFAPQEEIINHYTPDVQRVLVSNSFCKGDTALLDTFQPARFNLIANAGISRDARDAPTPELHKMAAPVLLLLGECSYIPRGRAMEYFGVYRIARSHLIPGVGHIVWGNAKGQELTRDAILRFIDNAPGTLPNEPSKATATRFVESGR
jgi:pimeloyl-ACP methyl ester carboxylesterase